MNVLSRRGFSVLLVALVAFMSLFFAGCASDEEKFIKLNDEFNKLEEDYGKASKKFKWSSEPNSKASACKIYAALATLVAEDEKAVEEMKAIVEKQKALVEKMEPLGKKTLALKEELSKAKLMCSNHLDIIKSRNGTITMYKEIMQNPNSYYNRSKATGFTDAPGWRMVNTWK